MHKQPGGMGVGEVGGMEEEEGEAKGGGAEAVGREVEGGKEEEELEAVVTGVGACKRQ